MERIKFNRNELSGAFGDIGTDLPLIIGMLLATDFEITNVLILFGAMQIVTGLIYGIPMAVQPLKAVALIVITQKISGNIVLAGGLVIGIIMLVLSLTNLLGYLEKIIPKTVIRGVQFGLGIQLALIALKDYIPSDGAAGYVLASIAFVIGLVLIGNRKYPPALFIISFGLVFAFIFKFNFSNFHFSLPGFKLPQIDINNLWTGFALLALPQIPLSLGNSIFATKQIVNDLYPEKKLTVKKIGITYGIMNITGSLLGGIPVCHGSGGLIGHYTFGGRTGGSAFIYGLLYILLGLVLNTNFVHVVQQFPKPILGVILLFEGISLIFLVKDTIQDTKQFMVAIVVALIANGVPNGYFIAILVGTILYYSINKYALKYY